MRASDSRPEQLVRSLAGEAQVQAAQPPRRLQARPRHRLASRLAHLLGGDSLWLRHYLLLREPLLLLWAGRPVCRIWLPSQFLWRSRTLLHLDQVERSESLLWRWKLTTINCSTDNTRAINAFSANDATTYNINTKHAWTMFSFRYFQSKWKFFFNQDSGDCRVEGTTDGQWNDDWWALMSE